MVRKIIITVLLLLLAVSVLATAQELPVGPVPPPPPPLPRAERVAVVPVFASWRLMFAAGRTAERMPCRCASCSCACCAEQRGNHTAHPGEHRH